MNKNFRLNELVNIVKGTGRVAGYYKNDILVDHHESIKLTHPISGIAISKRIPILKLYRPSELLVIEE